jgi:cytidylate kinase
MIVALDGPAGVGKSTIAKCVADRTGMKYINSGNLYRAVTWRVLDAGIDPRDEAACVRLASEAGFELIDGDLHVDGRNVEDELHTDPVDAHVAAISSFPEVRNIVNRELRSITAEIDAVVEGRDITTVVFPDAEVKVFLDASVETRAERRYAQGTSDLTLDEIKQSISDRDHIDRTKPLGRLELAPDAVYLDTSDLTIDRVCEKVIHTIHNRNIRNQE